MPSVSSQPVGRALCSAAATRAGTSCPAGARSSPGLVQNWPAPRVKEPTNPAAISSVRRSRGGGHHDRVHGAHLGVHGDDHVPLDGQSPHRQAAALGTREGDGGDLGAAHQGLARLEARDQPERTLGAPASASAAVATVARSALVCGWAGCAFATTGHPAAIADPVSLPKAPNAKGKLLAPSTATGPSGTCIRRRSGVVSVAWSTVTRRYDASTPTSP